ncbi:hypothetical protein AB0I34_10505 [Kribbella sp. NPDC050281]|uniref:hypothetical protein n=1 Tax=Kribbella sp. NPDC050281 TaxID=3155515 RepID=UPI0033F1ECD9
MARLTDDEIGELLRETFTEKEELTDRLPEATTRRRTGPILLAVAAILIVVAGALVGIRWLTGPASQPAAAAKPVSDTDIWVGAIEATARRYQPSDGWRQLVLLQTPAWKMPGMPSPAQLTELSRQEISRRVSATVPARWGTPLTASTSTGCFTRRFAEISVGELLDRGDHKEVWLTIVYGCGSINKLTYRVEPSGRLAVIGTSGTGERTPTACSTPGRTPANAEAGC